MRVVGRPYASIVRSYGPVAMWVLGEESGSVVQCRINDARDGTYYGPRLGDPGIGDGNTSPFFDGVNDWVDLRSSNIDAVFDPANGSLLTWFMMANAGVWLDGTERVLAQIKVDGNNHVTLQRGSVNNNVRCFYVAGGTIKECSQTSLAPTIWTPILLTWDTAADEFKAWWAPTAARTPVQLGTTQTGLGTWAGSPADNYVGSSSNVPAKPWHGWIAFVVLYQSALGSAARARLLRGP